MIIRRTLLPKNIAAMAIWPYILVRPGPPVSEETIRHERIHHAQQKELLLVPFFVWYGIEYLVRLCRYRNHHQAYRNISFESEAYMHDRHPDYLKRRKHYSFLKFLK
jgi:hypothetical protein